jgi:hypothetical protein
MKISELIAKLAAIQYTDGDLDVQYDDPNKGPIQFVISKKHYQGVDYAGNLKWCELANTLFLS